MAAHTVYAVASGKGGVGKTATTVNLGASLAEAGYTVAIVDTDLGMANLGGFIGIEPEQTLHEVLAGDASLESATYEALNGLAVVPSGISLNGFANVETAALADAVDALREAFDYVLLDLGAGLSHDTVLPLALADAVILVATPQPAAIQDTAKTRQITERLGGRVAGVVLTRAGNPADLTLEEVEETLDLPVLASIPEDQAVPASAREGQAVLQHTPDSPVVEGYRGLAGIIEDESLANAPIVPEVPEPEPDAGGEPATASPDEAAAEGSTEDDAAAQPSTAGDAAPQADDGVEADATGSQPEARTSGGTTQPEAGAQAGTTPEQPAEPGEQPAGESSPAAGGSADDEGDGETAAGDRSAETTAAEIAAAIEDAADDAGPTPGLDAEEATAADATPTSEEAAAVEPSEGPAAGTAEPSAEGAGGERPPAQSAAGEADAGGDEAGSPVDDLFDGEGSGGTEEDLEDVPDEVEAAAKEVEAATSDEEGALQVESHVEDDSDEGKAVDELFSVEGASPDDIDDEEEEESGGFLSKLFG